MFITNVQIIQFTCQDIIVIYINNLAEARLHSTTIEHQKGATYNIYEVSWCSTVKC